MKRNNQKICPVERAGALDMNLRKLFQNPYKILKPYIKEGMTVLDLGCGPGFFTLDIAKLAGKSGKVIAADLQQGMLDRIKEKIKNTSLEKNIKFHQCKNTKIGLSVKSDLILIFYMLHEVPDQLTFLKEIKTLLKPDGKVLIVEPKFHVSKKDFLKSISLIEDIEFKILEQPKIFFSRSVLIQNTNKK